MYINIYLQILWRRDSGLENSIEIHARSIKLKHFLKFCNIVINKLHQSSVWSRTWQEQLITIVQTVMNTSSAY